MAPNPLFLRISAQKSRTLVGEGIVLDVHHEVSADLDMETVELNSHRTRIFVTEEASGTQRVLSGTDHVACHRPPPLMPVGRSFRAPAGSSWTSQLELWLYTRPLPCGAYRVEIAYQHGTGVEDVVRSNAVAIEVARAEAAAEHRWFGGSESRDRLGALRVCRDGEDTRWLHDVALAYDPGVLESSFDLAMPAVVYSTAPRLAHLNDIAAFHFERWVAWTEDAGVGWVQIHGHGRLSEPARVAHGLAGARLVDPPLQLRAGGLRSVVLGCDNTGASALALIDVAAGGVECQRIPLGQEAPHAAVACWGMDETAVVFLGTAHDGGALILQSCQLPAGTQQEILRVRGQLLKLQLDQWMGNGYLHALVCEPGIDEKTGRELQSLVVWSVGIDGKVHSRPERRVYWSGDPMPRDAAWDAVPLVVGRGLALLVRIAADWRVLTPDGAFTVAGPPAADGAAPRLAATPSHGIFVLTQDPGRGPLAWPVGPPIGATP